jgi:hypothetical protein
VSAATGWLNGVAAISARDIWAVGFSGTRALILHFDGSVWRHVAGAAVGNAADGGMLIGVYAASRHNAWAVGCTKTFASIKARPLALHWNGTTWK